MTVYDLQFQLLKFQEEGLRLLQLCEQYPGFPGSSIPGYDAWLNNLRQYEQRYLCWHQTHERFQAGFSADNPQVRLTQLLQCLDIVNNDRLFWDDLKQKGLNVLENGVETETMCGGNKPTQIYNQPGLIQQVKPTVFLSYNWGSEKTADEVEKRLKPIANVLRDKTTIEPWGSISEFMKSIRKTDLVVVILSDAYLRSVACLYEIMQLLKDDNWISHSMFLVEDSAKGIYKSVDQIVYMNYWVSERENLEKALEGINPALVTTQADELRKIQLIQLNINDFMKSVSDRNNPDLAKAIDAVERRVINSCHQ